jgi:hypothetical protein
LPFARDIISILSSTGTCLLQTPDSLPSQNPAGIPRSHVACQNMIGETRKEKKEEKDEKER